MGELSENYMKKNGYSLLNKKSAHFIKILSLEILINKQNI